MTTRKAFKKYNKEGIIIGRLLAEYADIELSLFHCVNSVRDDFNTVYKAMFRTRGETRRIDIADMADRNTIVADSKDLKIRHIDISTLTQQESYFEYTDRFLTWLNFEGRRLAGKPSPPQQSAPKQQKQPPLYMK